MQDMEAYWRDLYETKKAEFPLEGLSVGDTVYGYDEDECTIFEIKVAHVEDGCGYAVQSLTRGVRLYAIGKDIHGKTQSEVASRFKKEIGDTVKYCEDLRAEAKRCLDLIDP